MNKHTPRKSVRSGPPPFAKLCSSRKEIFTWETISSGGCGKGFTVEEVFARILRSFSLSASLVRRIDVRPSQNFGGKFQSGSLAPDAVSSSGYDTRRGEKGFGKLLALEKYQDGALRSD